MILNCYLTLFLFLTFFYVSAFPFIPVFFDDSPRVNSPPPSLFQSSPPCLDSYHYYSDPVEDIIQFWKGMQSCYNIPGAILSIVRDDEVVVSEAYGLRDVDKSLPVTSDTLFGIGSITKSFTSTLLGQLVDENILSFSSKISSLAPELQFLDPHSNELMKLEDILSHSSGITSFDTYYVTGTNLTRSSIVKNFIRYMKPVADYHSEFHYNNLLYTAAGYILERLTGKSYEELLHEKIFDPLGMTSSAANSSEAKSISSNLAIPAYWDGSNYTSLPWDVHLDLDVLAPCGAINSNLNDISKWQRMLNSYGSYGNIISNKTLFEMFRPRAAGMTSSFSSPPLPLGAGFIGLGYGLGYFLSSYRGDIVINHGGEKDLFISNVPSGAIFGHYSDIYYLPNDKISIFFSGTGDSISATLSHIATFLYAYDRLMGIEPFLNISTGCDFPCSWYPHIPGICPRPQSSLKNDGNDDNSINHNPNLKKYSETPIKDPSDYIGTFTHPALSDCIISKNSSNDLFLQYNDLYGELVYVEYDIFDYSFSFASFASSFTIQFNRNPLGVIDSLTMIIITDRDRPIKFINENYNPSFYDIASSAYRPLDLLLATNLLSEYNGVKSNEIILTVSIASLICMIVFVGISYLLLYRKLDRSYATLS